MRDTICVLRTDACTVTGECPFICVCVRVCVAYFSMRIRDTHQLQHERERLALKLKLILSASITQRMDTVILTASRERNCHGAQDAGAG